MSPRTKWASMIAGIAVSAVVILAAPVYWFASMLGTLRSTSANAPASAGAGPAPERRVFQPTDYQQAGNADPLSAQPELQQPAPRVSEQPEQKAQLLDTPMPGSWEATPIAAQGRALGRAGVDLEQGLQDLQAEISRCFSKAGQSGYAGRRVLEIKNPEGDDTGRTIVVLQVEADRGELRISEAPVEIRSGASNATLACVQDKLRNVSVSSSAQVPAHRFRLRYAVAQ